MSETPVPSPRRPPRPSPTPRPRISIITPCYNEELNVEACAAEVRRVMESELPEYDYEHIFCDNFSTDSTLDRLRALAAADPRVKVVANSRNVGPFRNMANGLRHASGDLVVPMVPADIQDPPSVIPQMVAALTDKIDVVYGIRKNRRESLMMRLARRSYYSMLRATGGATPPAHAGEFLLARRDVIRAVNEAGGSYPYIRGLIAQTNPRFATVYYDWAVRTAGRSRNSTLDLVDQALNGLISTARTPVRLALLLGIVGAAVGIVAGLVNIVLFLTGDTDAAAGIPTILVATFLFGGTQLFFLGLTGEYVLSIHAEVRPPPPMYERERINLDESPALSGGLRTAVPSKKKSRA